MSDEGSDTETDEQHRTIRGREAQQIVKRLKGTYRGRSKSANDVLYSGAQRKCYIMPATCRLLASALYASKAVRPTRIYARLVALQVIRCTDGAQGNQMHRHRGTGGIQNWFAVTCEAVQGQR